MSAAEIIVIIAGLLIGWAVVWLAMSSRPPSTKLSQSEGPWFEVLGVPENASADEIRQAYRRKLDELAGTQPGILTEPERRVREQAREQIEAAYEKGVGDK